EHRLLSSVAIDGHAFRFRPGDVVLRVVPAAGLERVAALAPAGDAIATNASFFDEAGGTMGLAIDRGRSIGGRRLARWAAFVVDGGRARIVAGSALGDGAGADLVVQGFPRLVVAGAVPRLKPQRAQRTVLCVAGAHVVLLVTRSRVDASELARFLAAPADAGGLGCRDALNLDGGASTQLAARWGGFEARVDGASGVPNALVVTPLRDRGRAFGR
ncbi:MAG TPA: phosphodiester glycosidase family protein, partial [Myxococcota bacterium]|nr:phosphodiester glycosidase family protein [Myxococcota bacterium]